MDTRPIRFFHRGALVEVADAPVTRSVLDWLREDARCTGTKEGCGEGDCGACTVIVAEREGDTGLSLRPVNACIRFLPTLDGKALLTVEDLSAMAPGGALHPVQQAMVDCHGSQCGFCTPGFVMSLAATYERHCAAGTRPSRQDLADDLAGNLCRCTGYRPILDAGEKMFDLPGGPVRVDTRALRAQLDTLADDPPLAYTAPNPAVVTPQGQRVDRFIAPRSVDALADVRAALPAARLLAGSTDIGLWVNKQFRDVGDLLYVGDVAELKRIEERDGALHIGAGAPLEDAWPALVSRWPSLKALWLRFAGPPTRHAGTLGGNVANGSPIGDGAPVLMALGAQVLLRHGAKQRALLLEDFYLDYMKNAMQPGEFLESMVVPLPTPTQRVRAYKVSKRSDCDISALCAALAVEVEAGTVRSARLAFGGMAAIVKRAAGAEAALVGQPWNESAVEAAMAALDTDFTPLTDLRASAGYRREVARALLKRFWLETRDDTPLPVTQTQVRDFA